MDERETHLNCLRLAEQQFRLACTVNLAVANKIQTLDVPVEWAFGKHKVSYRDFGLRKDQADYAAALMEMTATFAISSAILNAVCALIRNYKTHENQDVVSAYQISRTIRNAFAHNMIRPKWSIDPPCQNKIFEIKDVIRLDTSQLQNAYLDWRHYGGPLAIFYFGRFVRTNLLDDPIDPNRQFPPYPNLECYQQGRMILKAIEELPEGATEIVHVGPGEQYHIGNGHWIAVPPNDKNGAD